MKCASYCENTAQLPWDASSDSHWQFTPTCFPSSVAEVKRQFFSPLGHQLTLEPQTTLGAFQTELCCVVTVSSCKTQNRKKSESMAYLIISPALLKPLTVLVVWIFDLGLSVLRNIYLYLSVQFLPHYQKAKKQNLSANLGFRKHTSFRKKDFKRCGVGKLRLEAKRGGDTTKLTEWEKVPVDKFWFFC